MTATPRSWPTVSLAILSLSIFMRIHAAEMPRTAPFGTVVSIGADGSSEVHFNTSIPFQADQQLLVYRRAQDGKAPLFVGTVRVSSVRDQHVTGLITSGPIAVGDFAPIPRFLDNNWISENASLRDYAAKIAELQAVIESLRDGAGSVHVAFRKTLEADRVASTIISQDTKRQIDEAVAVAVREKATAEADRDRAVERERQAETARQVAEEARRTALGQIESLREDWQDARDNLRTTAALVDSARRDYDGLVALKRTTESEIGTMKNEIANERRVFEGEKEALKEREVELAAEQARLETARMDFAKQKEADLKLLAAKEKGLKDEVFAEMAPVRARLESDRGDFEKRKAEELMKIADKEKNLFRTLREEWKAMDEAQRADWLLTRLSSDEGFKEVETTLEKAEPDAAADGLP